MARVEAEYDYRALIIVSVALHAGLNENEVFPKVHQRIVDAVAASNGGVRILCLTMHSPQANKPKIWAAQGPDAVRLWNVKLTSFCKNYGADVLDSAALTENATSYDGTHFGANVNFILAQSLFNFLADVDN
jgi:hypothetical protein